MNCLNIHDVQKKQELCVEKCFKILFEYFFMNEIQPQQQYFQNVLRGKL